MPDIPIPKQLLPVRYTPDVSSSLTSMRVHELALQRFFNRTFFALEGYPTPLVFATPSDAFSTFRSLFGKAQGPFAYLLDAKDADGVAYYRTSPEQQIFPLISVERGGWSPRVNQSYGLRGFRPAYYVSAGSNVKQRDLAVPIKVEMPTAWDFKYNVEHYCRRPDTHAMFIKKLMRAFKWMAGSPQTWIPVVYPDFFGTNMKQIRIYIQGDVNDTSGLVDGPDNISLFRTSFSVVIEGYDTDLDVQLTPAFWTLNNSYLEAVAPGDVEKVFTISTDLRENGTNPVFSSLANLPPK